jgi:hypothetical protein
MPGNALVHKGPRNSCFRLAFRQRELGVLKVDDGLPEGLALFDVGDGFLQRPVDPWPIACIAISSRSCGSCCIS